MVFYFAGPFSLYLSSSAFKLRKKKWLLPVIVPILSHWHTVRLSTSCDLDVHIIILSSAMPFPSPKTAENSSNNANQTPIARKWDKAKKEKFKGLVGTGTQHIESSYTRHLGMDKKQKNSI